MLPFQPEELGLSLRIDNRLAAVRVANGEVIELYEVVELMAACRCLFDLAVLTGRELGTVRDCLALWSSMRDQFSELYRLWEGVSQNGEAISVHRAELGRLKGLCEDRRGMFVITARERIRYAKNREDSVQTYNQRGGIAPDGFEGRGSTPAHVYSLGRVASR